MVAAVKQLPARKEETTAMVEVMERRPPVMADGMIAKRNKVMM